MNRLCFVVMPIKSEGTPEYSHFKGLYDVILKPAITSLGFEVRRSDEVQRPGAITKDIILMLAEADLVVVDITDLNPNVFYEMGVRHSLKAQGTVMIVDELRTEEIPFDLSAYRVIKFQGELTGFDRLRREITAFVQAFLVGDVDRRDNPVHDAVPALPLDALHSATGSTEGDLRERLANAEKQLRVFEQTYGAKATQRGSSESPLSIVDDALADASEGLLPPDLIHQAEDAAAKRDQKAFLTVVKRAYERKGIRLSARQFLMLARLSARFELDQITGSIYEYARQLYPADKELRKSYLAYSAHSQIPSLREKARQELLADLEINVSEQTIDLPSYWRDFSQFGIMLDAFHADGLLQPALRITKAATEKFPTSTVVARNYARALEAAKMRDDAFTWFRKAVFCPDADDTSCVWFGNHLHNLERLVDALEAYVRACLLDPDDATNFSQVVDEIAWALKSEQTRSILGGNARPLPTGIDMNQFEAAVRAAISSPDFAESDWDRCRMAAKRIQVDVQHLASILQSSGRTDRDSASAMNPLEKLKFASELYALLRSEVTTDAAVAPVTSGAAN